MGGKMSLIEKLNLTQEEPSSTLTITEGLPNLLLATQSEKLAEGNYAIIHNGNPKTSGGEITELIIGQVSLENGQYKLSGIAESEKFIYVNETGTHTASGNPVDLTNLGELAVLKIGSELTEIDKTAGIRFTRFLENLSTEQIKLLQLGDFKW
jgi:hypothetical protein